MTNMRRDAVGICARISGGIDYFLENGLIEFRTLALAGCRAFSTLRRNYNLAFRLG